MSTGEKKSIKWLLYGLLVVFALLLGLGYASEGQPTETHPAETAPVIGGRWLAPTNFASQFHQAKIVWTKTHPGQAMTLPTFAELSQQAFGKNTSLTPETMTTITQWSLMGNGSHPWVMVPQVAVNNPTADTAWLNLAVTAEVNAHVAPWLVDDELYLTDTHAMATQGEWQVVAKQRWQALALLPGQTHRWMMSPVNVAQLLSKKHSTNAQQPSHWLDQFSVTLTVVYGDSETPITEMTTLKLQPDIFAVPFWQSP